MKFSKHARLRGVWEQSFGGASPLLGTEFVVSLVYGILL